MKLLSYPRLRWRPKESFEVVLASQDCFDLKILQSSYTLALLVCFDAKEQGKIQKALTFGKQQRCRKVRGNSWLFTFSQIFSPSSQNNSLNHFLLSQDFFWPPQYHLS